VPKTDTLSIKPDSAKKDTLTTLRRRPPAPDTLRFQPWR